MSEFFREFVQQATKTNSEKAKSYSKTIVKRFLKLTNLTFSEEDESKLTYTTNWFNNLSNAPFYLEVIRLPNFRLMSIFFDKNFSRSDLINYWLSHKENYSDKPGVLVCKLGKFKNWVLTDLDFLLRSESLT